MTVEHDYTIQKYINKKFRFVEISQHNASKFDTFLEYEKATFLFRFSKKSYVCFRVPKNIANFQGYCKPKYYLCYAKSKLSSASR